MLPTRDEVLEALASPAHPLADAVGSALKRYSRNSLGCGC